MKIISLITSLVLFLSLTCPAYAGEVDREKKSSGGNEALTGALMGGLLGAGLGAAVGSASGKAGQGAAIGAGVGAVGGTLLGASQARDREAASYEEAISANENEEFETAAPRKMKKRVIREYDEEGNVISEKEVKN